MASNVSFNPYLTTNALGSFSVMSAGFIQGVAMDDPSASFTLAGGVLAASETLPMWGGCAIYEDIPANGANPALGGAVGRATSSAMITGFSVLNQLHSALTTPQSRAPSVGVGGTVHFHRFGSGARIGVQIDPSLVSLDGGLITQQVSWDLTNQKIIAYNAGIGALNVRILDINIGNSMTVAYDGTNNYVTWTPTGSVALILI